MVAFLKAFECHQMQIPKVFDNILFLSMMERNFIDNKIIIPKVLQMFDDISL